MMRGMNNDAWHLLHRRGVMVWLASLLASWPALQVSATRHQSEGGIYERRLSHPL